METKIYYLKDQKHENLKEWITGLNQSGYAGCNKQGTICDRREFPDAVPVQENKLFGVVEPKKTHIEEEEVWDMVFAKLDIANPNVNKLCEFAMIMDLEWDDEVGKYKNPDF